MQGTNFLKRRWWFVAVITALSLAAATWLTSRQERIYEASASLVVRPTTTVQGSTDILRSLETLERRTIVSTFARIPAAPETRVAAASILTLEPREIRGYQIWGVVEPYTNIIRVVARGPDAQKAAQVANAAAEASRVVARSLYSIYTLKMLSAAVTPYRPVLPDPQRNLIVAGLVGLLLGVVAAVVWEKLARREAATAIPIHAETR